MTAERLLRAYPLHNLDQASVLANGDYGGEEAFRQPGGPAAHSSLCATNQNGTHLSVRQEEEYSNYSETTVKQLAKLALN